jgi:hypothetical protein
MHLFWTQGFAALPLALQPTGNVDIIDNHIENVALNYIEPGIETEFAGIMTLFSNANIRFSGNTVKNIPNGVSNGLRLIDNFSGVSIVENNNVAGIGAYGIDDWSVFTSQPSMILRNSISDCGDSGIHITGIFVEKSAVVKGNSVKQSDSNLFGNRNGISIVNANMNYIGQNNFSGNGQDAILVSGSSDNIFVANNISEWTDASIVTMANSSNNNMFIGHVGTVNLDDCPSCTGNVITGLTPVSGGVGPQVSEALQQANDYMESLRQAFANPRQSQE